MTTDADALRHDPAFRLATSSAAGLTPLEGPGLASQPTLSRFTALMATPANLKALREAVLEMAGRGIKAERKDRRLRSVTLDVDSAPRCMATSRGRWNASPGFTTR